MIKCSECGYENIDGLDYCDGCGAKLSCRGPGAGRREAAGLPRPKRLPQPAPAEARAPKRLGRGSCDTASKSEAPTGEIKPPRSERRRSGCCAGRGSPRLRRALRQSAKLQVVRGGRKGQEFPLEDGNNLVGRWDPETGAFPEVDLDPDDPEAKISRKHALIRFESGKITVEDIGSLNGTYVNRQPRLMPGNPVELKTGDEIIIGKTFLKLIVEPVS